MTPYRVGLIVPSSNVTMETEVPALLARHPAMAGRGVTFHSSRAALHRVDPESLQRMVAESDRCARELADARLDVVAYACLIAIMAAGTGAHEAAEERLAGTLAAAGSAVPVTSSAGALVRRRSTVRFRRGLRRSESSFVCVTDERKARNSPWGRSLMRAGRRSRP
jgi:maleate isomerase